MNEFLDVAKSLEIKEISKDVECDDVDSLRSKENLFHQRSEENDDNIQIDNEKKGDEESSINHGYNLEELGQIYTKATGYKDEAGKYQCGKCEKQFSKSSNLYQ